MVPAAAVLPKLAGDAVFLADPVFDHAKVALIDDMARLGLPPGNPFFADGRPFAYYYLWHFSAAEIARLLGRSGWEADAGLTWFSAFASLAAMMGLALWLARRALAAPSAVLFAATASARYLLWDLFGAENVDAVLSRPAGFAGFLFQSAWVPQHIISAALAMVAVYLIAQLAHRRNALVIITLGLVAAAGFESSTWIGGFAFAASALVAVPLLFFCGRGQRALALSRRAHRRGDHRGGGRRAVPARSGRRGDRAQCGIADCGDAARRVRRGRARMAAPLLRLAGLLAGVSAHRACRNLHSGRDGTGGVPRRPRSRSRATARRACPCGARPASLTISWLLASTLADNNDLGWRAVLPAAMVLTVFSAAGLARWIAARAWAPIAVTAAALLVGLPGTAELIHSDMAGRREADAKLFARTPDLWAAVRRHAGPGERVANNPLFLADMTLWPVDISWALLADRRSCFAGRELALVYASLPRPRLEAIDAQFIRVFAGKAERSDIEDLATKYDCRLVVLTSADGAWASDPFAADPHYRLVEEKPGAWRIYRVGEGERER